MEKIRLGEVLKQGDRVKVRFGKSNPPKYKRGRFLYYKGKFGYFMHTTGKVLKRKPQEFLRDV